MVKVLPMPSLLSTVNVPPIITTSCLVMTSPSPVPPYCRVVRALSTCVVGCSQRRV